MKIKFSFEEDVPVSVDVLEERIFDYLKRNCYRISEKGIGYVIFIEDEYSDRKKSRSDFHNRVGEGKFIYNTNPTGSHLKLICLTPILYPLFLFMLFSAMGVYVRSVFPSVFASVLLIPIIVRYLALKNNVFEEIMRT